MIFNSIIDDIELNWDDISWGYKKHLIGWKDLVNYANKEILLGNTNEFVNEISLIDKNSTYRLDELLEKIVTSPDDYNNEKWLYISLLQLFSLKESIEDPLGEVEKIYEDFDYPEDIESFVRYMPVNENYDPSKHTPEENTQRLYEKWALYLDSKKMFKK
ncbi:MULTISPECIES: DUF2247 family protein [Erwinia]|uniref:DUF2247 family protein n=1 Tax=Erwinia TaxID=551 RepID=UPI001331BF0B|nr:MULTISPECIES: DUF2247 family protein [Erwinia]MBP2153427.1 hypothetical protein [Erwinia rhapontici]NNS08997.1 DUF2247 family protein [Erwinia sp. JH02]